MELICCSTFLINVSVISIDFSFRVYYEIKIKCGCKFTLSTNKDYFALREISRTDSSSTKSHKDSSYSESNSSSIMSSSLFYTSCSSSSLLLILLSSPLSGISSSSSDYFCSALNFYAYFGRGCSL